MGSSLLSCCKPYGKLISEILEVEKAIEIALENASLNKSNLDDKIVITDHSSSVPSSNKIEKDCI